ncbi:GNAT family N-acetyltransferase [Glutamicibacter sp. AOP5-A2-18]|uniref:GNAT family N-acetyltransferase n=1 Tax=Glutamicibacter sp. AOP5-A2-18 TaxID=3457656 RepID=UPI0040337C96
MKELLTQRLHLRSWTTDDAPFLLDLESRAATVRYLGPGATCMTTLDQALASIARRRGIIAKGQGIWAVADRETDALVGNVLCKPLQGETQQSIDLNFLQTPIEVGWHLHPSAQGQGFATEAVREVLNYVRESGGESVLAIVDPGNVPSQKVCQRLDFARIAETNGYAQPEHWVFRRLLS